MDLITNLLNQYITSKANKGVKEHIARQTFNYLKELPTMHLSDFAKLCHTSSSSIIRFCQELGFEDYTHFKEVLVNDQICRKNTLKELYRPLPLKTDDVIDISEWCNDINQQKENFSQSFDHEKAKALASDLRDYDHIYIYGDGFSLIVADYLRQLLTYHNIFVQVSSTPDTREEIKSPRERSLAILISQHLRSLNGSPRLLSYLYKNFGKTWILTNEKKDTYSFPVNVLSVFRETDDREGFHDLLRTVEIVTE